jgi:Tfp pilus assembly protein PilF
MSLLMDALKRAELAKQKTAATLDGRGVEPSEPLSLAPVESAPNPPGLTFDSAPSIADDGQKLPELPSRMEDLDEQFSSSSPRRFAPPTESANTQRRLVTSEKPSPIRAAVTAPTSPAAELAASAKDDQAAIKNLFAAKSPVVAEKNHLFAISVGTLTVLATLGIGGYFWWQLQPKSSMVPMVPLVATAAPIIPAPPAATAPTPQTASPAAGPEASSPAPGAVPPAPTFPPAAQSTVIAAIDTDRSESQAPTKSSRERQGAPVQAQSARVADSADGPVKRTKSPLRVNLTLARGYELFERGDLAPARQEYENVLKSEPQNVDALHGMAAISVRENRLDAAEHFFRQVLIADPQDANAIAGLINLRGHLNPAAAESRLRGVTAAQPELAAPSFALGNLMASQSRWEEAQQAYFKAYSAEPGNPDILFNLAVSLEHLRQNKLARQYYALAIEAAERHAAGFEPDLARARLRSLQP